MKAMAELPAEDLWTREIRRDTLFDRQAISDVERICGRDTRNESLQCYLRLEIPAYNLVPM